MSRKILIRTPNHLGDCIMAMPMINESREAYPGAEITIITPQPLEELYHRNPSVDQIIPIPAEHIHGLISVFKIKDLIAEAKADIGYILPPSFGAASAFKLASVTERIGYVADGRRLLLTKPLPLPTPLNSTHRSNLYFDLLRRGSGSSVEYVKPKVFLDEQDSQRGITLLSGFDISENDRYAVVAFKAVAESRRWGKDKYTELADRLVNQFGMKVLLVGSANDRPEGDEIAVDAGITQVINLAGKTTLRELAAICSRAQIFIGNDSGPAHLAAAVGIPLIVLSGADDPKETTPISNNKKVMIVDSLECISCVKNKCPLNGDDTNQCMKQISVDMVTEEIYNLLGEPE